MKNAIRSSLVALTVVGLFHCGSPPSEEESGDTGDDSEALSISGCSAEAVLAAAPNAERRAIIQRAVKWVHDGVLYSQTATHEGYRRDCSGFVEMAWGAAKPGASTAGLAPYDTSTSHAISWSELQTGDAVNVRAGAHHHVMLWGMWLDKNQTQACILQENHTGTPANIKAYAASYVKTYHPIRGAGIAAATGSAPRDPSVAIGSDPPASAGAPDAPDAPDPAASGGTSGGAAGGASGGASGGSSGSASGGAAGGASGGSSGAAPGGAACGSDGACNPGADGSGLICESGQCVPGCRNSSQCPGTTTCVGGSCQ